MSAVKWIKKIDVYTHMCTEFYSVIKKNEIMLFVRKWMDVCIVRIRAVLEKYYFSVSFRHSCLLYKHREWVIFLHTVTHAVTSIDSELFKSLRIFEEKLSLASFSAISLSRLLAARAILQ